ncbi:MAG: alpha/beta hydrolase, partial [Nitrospira sp.]|nr:alpha/beta hydrolase [Nitrospira sp.]
DDQMGPFAQHYLVIRYDLRGEGHSSSPPGLYTDHDDLRGLLAYLGLKQAIIMGVSNGGRVAINFALAYPEMVQALVLVASGVDGYEYQYVDEATEQLDAAIDAAMEKGDVALAAELETRLWVDGSNRTPNQVDAQVRSKALAMNFHNLSLPPRQGQKQQPETPAMTRLEEIKAPTLVIVGDQDIPDMQANADLLAARIPGAKKVVIPATAHLPSMEKPPLFNQIVLDFLRTLK